MLDLARVVGSHPESNTVDLIFLASGVQVTGVQVMSGAAGAAHGFHDLPQPREQDVSPSDPFAGPAKAGSDRLTLAVVARYRELPVVLGFLFPQVAQCLFAERDRMVYRHASDVYFTIDGQGNTELAHPSGVSLRIAETPGHEDLTGQDFDGRWKIERNTGRSVHVQLTMPNATVHITPSGAIQIDHAASLTVNTGGTATIDVTGNATVIAPKITLDADEVECTGDVHILGGLAVDGTTHSVGTIDTAGDVLAGNISLRNHRHGGVQTGSGTSGSSVV